MVGVAAIALAVCAAYYLGSKLGLLFRFEAALIARYPAEAELIRAYRKHWREMVPGPVPGMHALNEMVACARRLHSALGGVLQDDRGVPLTVHRIERMRQEVREFERPGNSGARAPRGEGYQE